MKRTIAIRFPVLVLISLLLSGVLSAAQPQRPQLKIEFRAVGQKFTQSLNTRELEKQATQKLVGILTPRMLFLNFSATDGDTVLRFRLNSRGEEGVILGDPREIDLFISLDGPNTEPGGKDIWKYRAGSQHSEGVGSLEDVVEKIAICAQNLANLQSLVRSVLGHVVLGRGGLLQITPELRWIFPFGLTEMCFAPNDTTFKVVHEGLIQNVMQKPRAYVTALGPYVPQDNQADSDLRNHWVGVPGIPADVDPNMHDKIQQEMERIKNAAPGSLQVKEIYVLVYERPLDTDSCGPAFLPGTPNATTGGHGQ
jgi:hypothetical protein